MITREPIAPGELATRIGRSGVIYILNDGTETQYEWDSVGRRFDVIADVTAASLAASTGAAGVGAVGVADVQDAIDAMMNVADYASLRLALRNTTAKHFNVTGYYVTTAPTGIAGKFTRGGGTAPADNGGTIIVDATSGEWAERILDGADPDIEMFGAVRGAGADQTVNSAAINACCALNRAVKVPGSTLTSDAGTFFYNTTIDLQQNNYFYGEGQSSCLKYTGSAKALSISRPGSGHSTGRDQFLTLSNFRLESATASIGIWLDRMYHTEIDRVRMWGFNTGFTQAGIVLFSDGSNNAAATRIHGCNIQTLAGHGIQFDQPLAAGTGGAAVVIEANRIQACTGWGVICDDTTPVECSIVGNDIEGNTAGGIRLDYPLASSICFNHLEYVVAGVQAIELGTGAQAYGCTIVGNNISVTTVGYAVKLTSFQYGMCVGNYISGYTTGHVDVLGSPSVCEIQSATGSRTYGVTTLQSLTINAVPISNIFGAVGHKNVTTAELTDIGGSYNVLGKTAGATYYNTTTNKLMVASGATAGALWYDPAGGSAITPV